MPTIYAAMRNGLLVGQETGNGYRVVEHLAEHDLECVDAVPAAPNRVFCGTFDAGLHRSTDAGETFTRIGAETLPTAVMSLTISPHDPETIVAGTEPSRVFRSTDAGETWTELPGLTDLPSADQWYFPPRPETHHVRWIEIDPTDPDRLYLGIEAGAFVYSTDGGVNWQDRPPGSRRDNHSLACHPAEDGRIYAAAGDGYAESTDGGESWTQPQAGLDHRYCWSVQPDPMDPDTVVLSSARGPRTAHSLPGEAFIYRRTGTEDWQRVDTGIPTGEGTLRAVLETTASATFYAVSNRGLFQSPDTGQSWESLAVEWPDRFERQTPRGLAVIED